MRIRASMLSAALMLVTLPAISEQYPFDEGVWQVTAVESEVAEHLGQRAMKIKGGYATIKGLDLMSGLIEFDIAVTTERGFSGAIYALETAAQNTQRHIAVCKQFGEAVKKLREQTYAATRKKAA